MPDHTRPGRWTTGGARALARPATTIAARCAAMAVAAVRGTAVRGTAVRGTAIRGTAVTGTAVTGTAVTGTAVRGTTAAVAAVTVAAMALGGCAPQQAAAITPIKVASAYIMKSSNLKTVDAYFVIANSGPADHLLSVRSSAGGKVLMVGPPAQAHPVTELSITGHGLTRLDPAGSHLEIVDSGPIREGTDITLTLRFAHAGQLKILAQVNNPQTPSTGYFGP